MEEQHQNNMNRRDFLKIAGIAAATSTAALYGCGSKESGSAENKTAGPVLTDK
ncbi:MAG: twin-arginine translocation signal domain-containing protein, partial [Bacteroides sp.]|nr:twin-arginine translocation signal domain-containing protein [Bacteroides sp.]